MVAGPDLEGLERDVKKVPGLVMPRHQHAYDELFASLRKPKVVS